MAPADSGAPGAHPGLVVRKHSGAKGKLLSVCVLAAVLPGECHVVRAVCGKGGRRRGGCLWAAVRSVRVWGLPVGLVGALTNPNPPAPQTLPRTSALDVGRWQRRGRQQRSSGALRLAGARLYS
jgi:hypothetical protein